MLLNAGIVSRFLMIQKKYQDSTGTQPLEQSEETPAETPAQTSESAAENPPVTETANSQTPLNMLIDRFKPSEIPISKVADLADPEPEGKIEIVLAKSMCNTFGNIINSGRAATKNN